jgi:hypothetical protein
MAENTIKKVYYDPETGYSSAIKLHKKIKSIDPKIKISIQQVQDFLDKQYTNQLNRKQTKPKQYNSIVSYGPKNNYQMDIISYDRYSYKNYSYILCIIDVYSRYASCRAMTSRKLPTIIENIKSIMKEMGWPKNMNCDNEFNKESLIKIMNDNGTKMWFSEPDELNKNAIVERFNRTIAEKIQLWRTATGEYDWPKVLPKLVKNYNNTEHRTIKNTPNNIFYKNGKNNQEYIMVDNKFAVGDKVRLKKKDKVFDKNDMIRYSKTIYVITRIEKNKIYFADDKKEYGPVKPYELKLANEVQFKEPEPEIDEKEEEKIHNQVQTERRITRSMRREGIDSKAPEVKNKREWKPISLQQFALRRK